MSLPAAAQADIYRWDNGELIPGTEGITPGPGVNLGSPIGEWSSPQRNLRFADFSVALDLSQAVFSSSWLDNARFYNANLTDANLSGATLTDASLRWATLTNADLSGTNLTGASLGGSTLSSANFAGAVVAGVHFGTFHGGPVSILGSEITLPQLYSTASYQQKNLQGIGLEGSDLTGGDFAGQNLTNATFFAATLTDADFTDAEVRGTHFGRSWYFGGTGITLAQVYSTASYGQWNLGGIGLDGNDLSAGRISPVRISVARR
jgi:uncharacterized protein YjbI with pentapeptide repeats